MLRKRMSRRGSKRSFRRGKRVKGKNKRLVFRGGYRL